MSSLLIEHCQVQAPRLYYLLQEVGDVQVVWSNAYIPYIVAAISIIFFIIFFILIILFFSLFFSSFPSSKFIEKSPCVL